MTCLIVDDDPIARAVVEHMVQRHDALSLVGVCADGVAAASRLAALRAAGEPVGLVLLDVEMPEMTGLELAEAFGSGPERPQVVLITSKEEYAREAFDVDATDYIVKPVTHARFLKAVERALARRGTDARTEPQNPDLLFVKSGGRFVRVDLREVEWAEAQKDYVLFHTPGGDHLVHTTMKALAERLPAAFVRIHRSFFVRLDHVRDVEEGSVVVGKRVLPVGTTYRAPLLDRLNTL